MKKINLLIAFIPVVLVPLFIYFVTDKPANTNQKSEMTITVTPSVFAPDPNHQISHAAWIPDWASTQGADSFANRVELFDSISPVWYEVREDGSLVSKRPYNAAEISGTAEANSISLIPAIAMFDHELFSKVLATNLDVHVRAIVDEVLAYDYDGIDLDYESTKLADKEKYFEFLQKLSSQLHQNHKQLVVTVLAKWGDNVIYPSLRETRQVQDWAIIAELADEIRIMAYDYTFAKAQYPGPIAPISWVDNILSYAVTQIPRQKIVLGIHLYSYEWYVPVSQGQADIDRLLQFVPGLKGNKLRESGSARSYTYQTVKSLIQNYQGELSDFEAEKIFRYQKINPDNNDLEERVLVFIDKEGVMARENLAKDFNIKGVVYWRLGGEIELLER